VVAVVDAADEEDEEDEPDDAEPDVFFFRFFFPSPFPMYNTKNCRLLDHRTDVVVVVVVVDDDDVIWRIVLCGSGGDKIRFQGWTLVYKNAVVVGSTVFSKSRK
jgi:hypothetical protein